MKRKKSSADPHMVATLFPRVQTRSEATQLQIIEAAIHSLVEFGVENTTYERIAKKAKVSRPLVIHYFPEWEQLILLSFKYIRVNMQDFAVKAIKSQSKPEKQMAAYIDSVFDWAVKFETHSKAWILFYYYCAIRPEYKALHTELVAMGHQRIAVLIQNIVPTRKFGEKELMEKAKVVQCYIAGASLYFSVETMPLSIEEFKKRIVQECLSAIRRD